MGENYGRRPMALLARAKDDDDDDDGTTTRHVLGEHFGQSDENNRPMIQKATTTTTKQKRETLDLLHHLIRAETMATRRAILRQLTQQHDVRPYVSILLRSVMHGIVVQRQYVLIRFYARVIMAPTSSSSSLSQCGPDVMELVVTVAMALLRDASFLAAPGSTELLQALGPVDGSKSLFAALHAALLCQPAVAVAFWSHNVIISNSKNSLLPCGMLRDFIICIDQRSQTDESETCVSDFCRILHRLVLHRVHRVELFETPRFLDRLAQWLAPACHKHLNNVAATIMAQTTDLYEWRRHDDHHHKQIRHRLLTLAAEGRALDAVVKIAAPQATDIAVVFAVATHINLMDINVPETSILAAKAVKRMIRSISVRVQTFPEALDLLAKISTAKNRHVRFWAVQGLAEEAQDVAVARFYLARSNLCLRALLLTMKKDYCLRVREASAAAVCAIAKDPANAMAMVRRSDFVPSLVDCVWTLLNESSCNFLEHNNLANSCNEFMEALLVLVSHKTADPERLANSFRLVETLCRFGNNSNAEFDRELQRVSLQCAALLEPFRNSSGSW